MDPMTPPNIICLIRSFLHRRLSRRTHRHPHILGIAAPQKRSGQGVDDQPALTGGQDQGHQIVFIGLLKGFARLATWISLQGRKGLARWLASLIWNTATNIRRNADTDAGINRLMRHRPMNRAPRHSPG
jgi:hypothetical protein